MAGIEVFVARMGGAKDWTLAKSRARSTSTCDCSSANLAGVDVPTSAGNLDVNRNHRRHGQTDRGKETERERNKGDEKVREGEKARRRQGEGETKSPHNRRQTVKTEERAEPDLPLNTASRHTVPIVAVSPSRISRADLDLSPSPRR